MKKLLSVLIMTLMLMSCKQYDREEIDVENLEFRYLGTCILEHKSMYGNPKSTYPDVNGEIMFDSAAKKTSGRLVRDNSYNGTFAYEIISFSSINCEK